MKTQKILTYLWYNDDAEDAIRFYMSLFEDCRIVSESRNNGKLFLAVFELAGQQFMAINAGPMFTFTEAISLYVKCKDQAEVDRLWAALTADGGSESRCGWLKDRWGLSWQIVPEELSQLMGSGDPARSQRVMQALLQMNKIDLSVLRAAYAGE